MSQEHTRAELDLLSIFATSHRIEYERSNAEYEVRKGLYAKAIKCLRRLLEELDQAREILLSLEPDREDAVETFKSMQCMLESQIGLVHSQLEYVEQEVSGTAPTPPHDENYSFVHQQQWQQIFSPPRPKLSARLQQRPENPALLSVPDNTTKQPTGLGIQRPPPSRVQTSHQPRLPRATFKRITRLSAPEPPEPMPGVVERRTYKAWPTADANYSRPALKPITFKMERDTLPRLPGDMSGAVHIRRQLDEQEEAVEEASFQKWLKDLGQDPGDEGDNAGPRGQKRPAGDDLSLPPSKKSKGFSLRGGNDDDGKAGLRKLFSNLNPFRRRRQPSSSEDTSGSSISRDNGFVNGNSGNKASRNDSATNKTCSIRASAPLPRERFPEIPPPVIVIENLCTAFGDENDDITARRYCDWFASLITLTEDTPGSITASGFMARLKQRKKLERLKTALAHMSIRPFEKRQATQQRIKSLEGGLKQHRETLEKLTEMEPTEEWEAQERQEDMEDCCEKMDRDSKVLERQEKNLALQVAFEKKIFVGGVAHGDCFLSWITKARDRVYWELSFADRVREKPERIMVGNQKYYSV
ncbi:hypothetical protein ColTof3_09397 [Colletotrichum tofieldiae]|nr:hypothetical protein ColTof3_09397 [Colletotrichum tofieldiae]